MPSHEPIALRTAATVPLRRRDPRGINLGMANPELSRDELEAALRARRELDRELEPHVIDAFLDRVEHNIDARVDARLQARGEVAVDRAKPSQGSSRSHGDPGLGLDVYRSAGDRRGR